MAKGIKQSTLIWTIVLVLGAVAVGAYVSHGTTFSITGGTGSTPSTTGTCPTSGFSTVSLLGSYIASNGIVVTPSVTSSVYLAGQSSPVNTVTTGSSATTVSGTVSCSPPQTVYATYGDANSGTYYLQATPQTSATGAVTQLYDTNLLPVAEISAPVFVNSQNGTYASNAIYKNAGNSQTYTSTMNLQAGNGVYGNTNIELLFAYNNTEIQSVTVTGSGASSAPVSIPSGTTYGAGYTLVAYTIPAMKFYNQSSYQVIVKTATLNSNTVVANPVELFIKDSASYMNNGQLVSNAYINSQTNTNIGHAVIPVSPASLIVNSGASATSQSSAAIILYS
jgi:hypothetical protein